MACVCNSLGEAIAPRGGNGAVVLLEDLPLCSHLLNPVDFTSLGIFSLVGCEVERSILQAKASWWLVPHHTTPGKAMKLKGSEINSPFSASVCFSCTRAHSNSQSQDIFQLPNFSLRPNCIGSTYIQTFLMSY